MRAMYWNLRGIANTNTQLALRDLCATNKPDILFVSEPMVDPKTISGRYWKLCALKFIAVNEKGELGLSKIWVCVKPDLQAIVFSSSTQQITMEILADNKVCRITGVYSSTGHIRRRKLWRDILEKRGGRQTHLFLGHSLVISTVY